VPKPKKAFQSPGAHKIGRKPAVDVVVVIARSSSWRTYLDLSEHRRQIVDRRLPLPQSDPAGDGCFNPVPAEVRGEQGRSIRPRGRRLGNSMQSPTQTTAPRRWLCEIPSDYGTILASVVPIMTTDRWPPNAYEKSIKMLRIQTDRRRAVF
jgi:hypothetical protein